MSRSVTIPREMLAALADCALYAAERHEEAATYGPEPGMTAEDHAAAQAEACEAYRAACAALEGTTR